MTNVLVTGGAGFIGSDLCRTLLEKGYAVTAVDNLITSSGDNLKSLQNFQYFTFLKHDIARPLPKLLSSKNTFDVIYHLACPTGVPNLVRLAEEMLQTCSVGTKNILDLAKFHGAKLIFTSSSEVYGDPLVFPQEEKYTGNVDPCGIRSPYEEGKRFSESLLMMYVRKYDLDAKIVRVFNTYGPGMTKSDSRVIPKLLGQIKNNKSLTIEGNGTQTRTFCYVDDLVRGILLVNEKGLKGNVYNLGSDVETAIIDLAKLIKKTAKATNVISFVDRPEHDHKRRLPSLSKIKKLGWSSSVTLEEGLRRTIQWYGL